MYNNSKHYDEHRSEREKFIEEYIGDGKVIRSFVVDKGHKDGAEIHSVTDTGLIIIRNIYTGKIITKLIARPNQINRYYKNIEQSPPKWLLDLAKEHERLGYNRRETWK